MLRFLQISNDTLFIYYLLSNIIYFGLLITAIFKNVVHRHRLASQRLELLKASPFTPPITLIVPAHNEERFIVDSVEALLRLDYPSLEVVVVNDGSRDLTLQKLQEAYQLQTARLLYIADIATAPLRAIYRSPLEPRLLVLDKEAAGSKADAIMPASTLRPVPTCASSMPTPFLRRNHCCASLRASSPIPARSSP